MQDDCYLIAADGWTCDLVPKPLIVNRYFTAQQAAIQEQESMLESVTAQMTELEEENSGEEGAFSELDKVNKANVNARLKEIKGDKEAKEDVDILLAWLVLSEQGADLKKALREAEVELDALAYDKYPKLTEAEIKMLVVNDKWLAAIAAAIHGEMDRISQTLTRRVKELAERYETPLPQQANKVLELERKVAAHLAKMGFSYE